MSSENARYREPLVATILVTLSVIFGIGAVEAGNYLYQWAAPPLRDFNKQIIFFDGPDLVFQKPEQISPMYRMPKFSIKPSIIPNKPFRLNTNTNSKQITLDLCKIWICDRACGRCSCWVILHRRLRRGALVSSDCASYFSKAAISPSTAVWLQRDFFSGLTLNNC